MPEGLKVSFTTLGCKLNQYETDAIASDFAAAGYVVGEYDPDADIQIVNTCTVTNRADRKSRNAINRARGRLLRIADAKQQPVADTALEDNAADEDQNQGKHDEQQIRDAAFGKKASLVVLTGCYVNAARDSIEADGRTLVIGNEQKNNIFHIVDACVRGEIYHPSPESRFEYGLTQQGFHARGTVKIQDGCDNFCTFCIIPFVRGRAASRPLTDILENVTRLVESGSREIVLTGVNMSRYSWEDLRFTDVVKAILDLPLDFRLRISSIEPDRLGQEFADLFRHPKLCPQVHLCLQSGSERTLLAMRRQYSYSEYRDLVRSLRVVRPDLIVTTDVIVGFPGESDDDFRATLEAVRETGFAHVHIFPYSLRTGTRAERMPGRVSETVKQERVQTLASLALKQKREIRMARIGSKDRMIVEKIALDPEGRKIRVEGTGLYHMPIALEMEKEDIDSRLAEIGAQSCGSHVPFSASGLSGLRKAVLSVHIAGITDGDDPYLLARLS